jgi:hypothetical protein
MSSQTNLEDISSQSIERSTSQTNIEGEVSNPKPKKKKISWIWKYFKEEKINRDNKEITVIVCQEMVDGVICGTTYVNSGSSTGNAANHLCIRHNITKNGRINNVSLNFLFIFNLKLLNTIKEIILH